MVNESKPEAAPGRQRREPTSRKPEIAARAHRRGEPEQKVAYDASAQRLEDLVRAQNPGVGAQPPVTFEHLVQQFYVSAMIQMGAGTQEGQRPRVDILGARTHHRPAGRAGGKDSAAT